MKPGSKSGVRTRVVVVPGILPTVGPVYRSYQGRGPAMIRLGRMTLSDITQDELTELCAAQFLVRCRAP
jgi:hypothetical protein